MTDSSQFPAPDPPMVGMDASAGGLHGFLLSSSMAERRVAGRKRTVLVFQGRLRDGRRFHWEVAEPRLCFFVDPGAPEPPVPHARKPLTLRTLRGGTVDALYFASAGDLARARRHYQGLGLPAYEADVGAAARHLMERGIQGGVHFPDPPAAEEGGMVRFADPRVLPSAHVPALRLLSLDVECAPGEGLYSIAVWGRLPAAGGTGSGPDSARIFARVFVVDPARPPGTLADGYEAQPDEKSLLLAFFRAVREFDPDVLVGWNVINFDLVYLSRRCARHGLPFDLGVDGPAQLVEPEGAGGRFGPQWLARVPGRAVLDGIAMLRAAFVEVEGYSLASVAHEVLGERKLIELEGDAKMAEITRRFREDKPSLARYNLEDARLAHAVFDKLGLLALAVRKAQLTGLALDRMGGSIAALDFLYLPRLHRRGFVADTESPGDGEGVPGGLVLDGTPGFFRNVIVLDFKSLYPSIIRSFQVDPLAYAAADRGWPEEGPRNLVRTPSGQAFVKEMAVLPGIVESLAEARERAKRERDGSLSQAVKIIMNSFYGVLGNPTCRFHHPDLAGAITRTGQWILLESKAYLEAAGCRVLYGDTDSLFVQVGEEDGAGRGTGAEASEGAINAPEHDRAHLMLAAGSDLCGRLNRHLEDVLRERFGAESRLTMEFDKFFLRFFLPALRREERGSKKRYAGLLAGPQAKLHFAGMESARSDWTVLAKDFQAALLGLVFAFEGDADLAALEALARDWMRRLFAGELDDSLVYRKGLSKDPEDYGPSAPPHVRAARILNRPGSRVIRYVMTVDGPEPVEKRSGARPDYRHYAEKQLAPVADMVLRFLGTSFEKLTEESSQLSML